jgi:hypothetical protein
MAMIVFPLVFVGVGTLFVSRLVIHRIYGAESLSWPTVDGVIEDVSSLKSQRGSSTVSVTYRYSVDGEEYRSSNVAFGYNRAAQIRARFERYAKGDRVAVFVRPGDPSVSVIEPGIHPSNYAMPLLGVFFILSGSWLGRYVYTTTKPTEPRHEKRKRERESTDRSSHGQ